MFLRMKLQLMVNLEAVLSWSWGLIIVLPTQVFDRMTDLLRASRGPDGECMGSVKWKFLGHQVFVRSWMRLHSIGLLVFA